MSEIDAIFASKGKSKSTNPAPTPTPAPSLKKKKKNKKKAAAEPETSTKPAKEEKATSSKKRPAPETVIDTSSQITQTAKRQKTARPPPEVGSKSKKDKEDEEDFKDSRGTGPRRKTEEGWSIFKEAELGIDPTAGDTPLCPFDCDCCF